MRIDKFLKISRVIKRRTEAKYACDSDSIKLNSRTAKAGDAVKVNDKIEIRSRYKVLEIEVLKIPEGNVSIPASRELYRIIEEEKIRYDQ